PGRRFAGVDGADVIDCGGGSRSDGVHYLKLELGRGGHRQCQQQQDPHGLPTEIDGVPIVNTGAATTGAIAAIGRDRPATNAPASAPPPATAAIAIHFRCEDSDPACNSPTYWKDTVPARACSFEARTR